MTIIEHLKNEHRLIEKFLLKLNQWPSLDRKNKKQLIEAIRFLVETVHHGKEEDILFPAVAEQMWIKQGGPKCSLFMGQRLENNPLDRFKAHLEHSQINIKLEFTKPLLNKWMQESHPLSIPLEEHIYGHALVDGLLQNLDNEKEFSILVEDYLQLLRLHIRKEDECLFIVCAENLNSELQRRLATEAEQYCLLRNLNKQYDEYLAIL